MPSYKQHVVLAVRSIRVFLELEMGVGRDRAAFGRTEASGGAAARHDRKLAQTRPSPARESREHAEPWTTPDEDTSSLKPENIVWIFGTGRSGNTWLSNMMEELEGHVVWRESSVGKLFGEFYYYQSREGQRGTRNFILGEKQKGTWLRSIRNFVLEGASGRYPDVGDGYLIIKEQVGSVGAPLLMKALPESRMILLVRDPRDVVASWVNATQKGGWRHERLNRSDPEWRPVADKDLDAFVEERANHYLKNVDKAKVAYEKHEGRKVLVHYEDLRSETLGTMRRIYSELGIEVDPDELARAVRKHAWENVPEEEKGEGKFYRKAKPGGWREDLTPEQVEVVERITAPLLKEFYPG